MKQLKRLRNFFVCIAVYCYSYVIVAYAADPVPVEVVKQAVDPAVWIALITMIGGTIATTIAALVQIYNGRIVRKAATGIDDAKTNIVQAAIAVEETKKEVAGMHNSVNSKMDALLEATRALALLEGRDAERVATAEKAVNVQEGKTQQKAASVIQATEKEARDRIQLAKEKVADALTEARKSKGVTADDLKIVEKDEGEK